LLYTTHHSEEQPVGIGAGIFLIAIGAILAFALKIDVPNVDLPTIGVILMIVGVLGVILDAAILMPRRRRHDTYDDPVDEYGRPVRRNRDGH